MTTSNLEEEQEDNKNNYSMCNSTYDCADKNENNMNHTRNNINRNNIYLALLDHLQKLDTNMHYYKNSTHI